MNWEYMRRGVLRLDCIHRRKYTDPRLLDAERDRKIYAFYVMSTFSSSVGKMLIAASEMKSM
jgi:hypothetical protein